MKPQNQRQFALTARVTWQNGVLLRIATALSRKGFEVVYFRKIGLQPLCDLSLIVEGPTHHLPHALVVLQQLIDVAEISLGKQQPIPSNTKNDRKKVASMTQ